MIVSYSCARRQAASSSSIVKSAVQSVSTSGVLVTTRPRARAAGTSMCSKPALVVAAMRTRAGSLSTVAASSLMCELNISASAPVRASRSSVASASRSRSPGNGASNSAAMRACTAGVICRLTTMVGRIANPPSSREPAVLPRRAEGVQRRAMQPAIDLAERLFAAIHDATRDGDGAGVTRAAYGPGEQAAHDLVRVEASRLDLEIAVDPAGNLLLTLPGADRSLSALVIGSHLDSVAHGGDYDGPAGVLAGLAVVAGMRREAFRPARDVMVCVVRAEEAGAWFPTSFPGSRAGLGTLPPEALDVRRLDTGRTLAEHMAEAGFDPEAVRRGACLLPPSRVAAYVELHIEQGPVLDTAAIPVGIVTGIPGSRRLRAARCLGEYNHSGATPRRFRRDAAIAVAELAVGLDAFWQSLELQGHALVVTFCVLATAPDAGFTKIAGEARFELDVRSLDPACVEAMFAELHRLVAAIEGRRGVRFDLGPESGSTAVAMHAGLRADLARAATAAGIAWRDIPSGGGHDAVAFAQAGVPSAMLFVRNQGGSHSPREAMRMQDFAAATRVLSAWAKTAAQ